VLYGNFPFTFAVQILRPTYKEHRSGGEPDQAPSIWTSFYHIRRCIHSSFFFSHCDLQAPLIFDMKNVLAGWHK
jgi:hypothetical protein